MNGMQAGFCQNPGEVIAADVVRAWFAEPVAVDHYARAAASLGLWRSEQAVFRAVFHPGQRLLDVGCGAGRIALGLARLGWRGVVGVDSCRPMVAEARRLAGAQGLDATFWDGDALALPFAAGGFDGAVFGFNGLMQIPGRDGRRLALREIGRVVAGGGMFVFTTHDRAMADQAPWWRAEALRWRDGTRDPRLLEFGDRILENPEGRIFMHVPDRAEVLEDLAATGWEAVEDHARSALANEGPDVRAFSDECRFWIARRRGAG